MSTATREYLREVEALGFRVLGTNASGHLVVEHPTTGVRTPIPAKPDGENRTLANTLGGLKRALAFGATAPDAFLDWLCHEYDVGPTDRKQVTVDLHGEVARWAKSPVSPKRRNGAPPNVESTLSAVMRSGRVELLGRQRARWGVASPWWVAGARWGLGAVEPELNGHGGHVNGHAEQAAPGEPATAEASSTTEAPESAVQAGLSAEATVVPSEDVAGLLGPLRALLLPDLAAREELVAEGLRELIVSAEATARAARTLLALYDPEITPGERETTT